MGEFQKIRFVWLIDENQNLNKRMLSVRLLVFISGYYLALSDLRQSPSDGGDSTSDCCCLVMAPSYFPNYRVTASLVWPNILLDRSPSHQTDRLADWHQYFQEQMFFFCLRMSTIYLIRQLIDICMNLFMISLFLSLCSNETVPESEWHRQLANRSFWANFISS